MITLAAALLMNEGNTALFSTLINILMRKDLPLWKIDSLPDLYIMVYNADGEVIHSSREEAEENNLPQLITIDIPQDLVERHRLLKT